MDKIVSTESRDTLHGILTFDRCSDGGIAWNGQGHRTGVSSIEDRHTPVDVSIKAENWLARLHQADA